MYSYLLDLNPEKKKLLINDVVALAKLGDEEAYEILLSKMYPHIVYLSQKIFIKGSDFDDFVQEASIKLINIIDTYDREKSPFIKFAQMAIKNHIITMMNKGLTKKHFLLNNALSLWTDQVRDEYVFINKMIEEEENERIWEEISQPLSDKEKIVAYLKIILGLSYKEMSRWLKIEEKDIGNALYRTTIKLRKKLRYIVERNQKEVLFLPFMIGGRMTLPKIQDYTEFDPDSGSYWEIGMNILESDTQYERGDYR